MSERIIKHGIPKHDYFAIAQPLRDDSESYGKRLEEQPIYTLIDPKSGERVDARFQEAWHFTVDELMTFQAFVKLTYGVTPATLIKALKRRYSNLKKVEFLLLKKVNL